MNILAKFRQKRRIFDEIRGHLLILLFYRALTRASEDLLQKKSIKVEMEVPHTQIFQRICLRRPKYLSSSSWRRFLGEEGGQDMFNLERKSHDKEK